MGSQTLKKSNVNMADQGSINTKTGAVIEPRSEDIELEEADQIDLAEIDLNEQRYINNQKSRAVEKQIKALIGNMDHLMKLQKDAEKKLREQEEELFTLRNKFKDKNYSQITRQRPYTDDHLLDMQIGDSQIMSSSLKYLNS